MPRALYSDKHSIFRQNQKEGYLRGDLTQYGRALKELGIELICAHTPQAKGRVERSFATHQDRLVKEMRLRRINNMEEANKFLKEYLKKHSKRFGVKPLIEEDGHKVAEKSELSKVFILKEKRTLSKGLSFQYKGVLYQIKKPRNPNRLQNQKVEICETLEGKLIVQTINGEDLEVTPYSEYTGEIQKTLDYKEIGTLWKGRTKKAPSRRHPWR